MDELELVNDNWSNIKATDNIFNDSCHIIDVAQTVAYKAVNVVLVQRNWMLGQRIEHEILQGSRADYGEQVIKNLSAQLTHQYGKGFNMSNLYTFHQFFKTFPAIFHSLRGNSRSLLSWTHYRVLLQVDNKAAREWYANEALAEAWSSRTLQRNISSQYYFRRLASHNKTSVEREMKTITAPLQDKLEFIKSPVVAEFLGSNPAYPRRITQGDRTTKTTLFVIPQSVTDTHNSQTTAKKRPFPTVTRRSTDSQGLRHYRNSAFSRPQTAQILRTKTILYIIYIICIKTNFSSFRNTSIQQYRYVRSRNKCSNQPAPREAQRKGSRLFLRAQRQAVLSYTRGNVPEEPVSASEMELRSLCLCQQSDGAMLRHTGRKSSTQSRV